MIKRRVRDVRGPPGGGDEPVLGTALQLRGLTAERHLHTVEQTVQLRIGLDLSLPVGWQRTDGIDGDDPYP